ncbi:hypothetical protein CKO09_07660 [Chromatium weissei]|nr:hypothetical protein [Chromatium weissei]
MSTAFRLLPIALTAVLTATPAAFAGNGRGAPPAPPVQPAVQPVTATLSATEAATLLFMREEERVARDVYLQFDTLWAAAPPFAGIAQSEQKHMDAIKTQIDRYGLTDPSDPTLNGVFANTTLQELYDSLILKGEATLLAALNVGALIEEVDIADLEDAIAATENTDLEQVYENLLRGSRNHLRAFVAEIERQGGDAYIAQHLTQEAVNDIVTTPMERGDSRNGGNDMNADGRGAGSQGAGGSRR